MKKILFIATGGTIASKKTENGLTPQITPEELLSYIPEVEGLCEITAVNPFNLDSSNVVPENWSTLVKVAKEHYEDYDGFVIAHGTDTMAYTAAALLVGHLILGAFAMTFKGRPLEPENLEKAEEILSKL